MGAAASGLDHGCDRVAVPGVEHRIGTQAFGVFKFAVVDVNRADVKTQRLGVLHPEMPEPANARDHDPFTRLGLGLLDALVRGDAGTDQRCSVNR